MKLQLILLGIVEVVFLHFAVGQMLSMSHGGNARTLKARLIWEANPSPETEANLIRERRAYALNEFAWNVGMTMPFVLNTITIVVVARRLRLSRQSGARPEAI